MWICLNYYLIENSSNMQNKLIVYVSVCVQFEEKAL